MSLKPKRVDFQETWHGLQETVNAVITLGNVPRSTWNDRFTDVYSLCVAYPEPLADKLYQETRQFLDSHVKTLLDRVVSSGEANLLRNYYQAWTEYSQGINYLHRLYSYLNQQHIKKQKLSEAEIIYGNVTPDDEEQMEIGELGLEIWKRNMIEPLQSSLVKLLLEGIHQDRVGDAQSSSSEIIKGVIHSFVGVQEYKKKDKLELYRTIFEAPFLEATGEYYRREASKYLQECSVSQYMEKVTQRLNEESMRIHHFLHCSSYNAVRAKCEEEMVAGHLNFLHSECEAMVVEERKNDLKNMYPLLHAVQSGLTVLVNHVMAHIKQQGLNAVTGLYGENMHIQFVESMLGVHKKYKQLIQDVFQSDQAFMGALDKACSSVINHKINPKQPCRSPELLAKYCDTLLKKSSKGLSESEIDDKLANSITIFKYIDDKDVFQKFYSKMLARRLIHQQSQSMDAEEAMINRLKQACGYEFTNKLHRMFTDISVSNDLNNKFNNHLRSENIELGINFSIYVLQAGAWPLAQANLTSFVLPQELVKSVQMFENFYHSNFNGRKLTWLHHLCQGELKLGYLKKPYIVTMQVFQMAVLLLFESTDSLVCSEIQTTLQLNAEQFNKYITSLVDCKLLLSSTEDLKMILITTSLTKSGHPDVIAGLDRRKAFGVRQGIHEPFSVEAVRLAGHCLGMQDPLLAHSSWRVFPSKECRFAVLCAGGFCSYNGVLFRRRVIVLILGIVKNLSVLFLIGASYFSNTITSDTQLTLNLEYSNKRTRLRITTAMQKESPQELEQTVTAVDEDRKLYLQAAIVRIMKSRKVLRHNALIQEVLSQSKAFAPAISMIKKCIEALIDKQYIERTPNSSDEYSYVA